MNSRTVLCVEPGEGGADAASFASEFGAAAARWLGVTPAQAGTSVEVPVPTDCL